MEAKSFTIEDSKALAQATADAAEEMKALDVVMMNVSERTTLTDYLVICSGTSDTHLKSIANNIQDTLRNNWKRRAKPQGTAESFWMVLDYGDVIVHIFDENTREFYDLERLWSSSLRQEAGAIREE
ncbi:MAG: ribosome silencing factor [Abditibacteriaceae bacterium]